MYQIVLVFPAMVMSFSGAILGVDNMSKSLTNRDDSI
jgi:hypothetical protein